MDLGLVISLIGRMRMAVQTTEVIQADRRCINNEHENNEQYCKMKDTLLNMKWFFSPMLLSACVENSFFRFGSEKDTQFKHQIKRI